VVRRRKRASALISAALDAIEAGDRGAALALVGRAARNDPRALLTLRAAGTLFGLVPGARSREWLGRTREAADARRAQASS
jgi:hypothetical protein